MEMEYELFYSKLKPSVGRSSLLDVIGDSPLGENPHRVVAMELIFDKAIDDCQERMLVRAKKSPHVDPAVLPSNRKKSASTLTTVTQPTPAQLPPQLTQSKPTVANTGASRGLFSTAAPKQDASKLGPSPLTNGSAFKMTSTPVSAFGTTTTTTPSSPAPATNKPTFPSGPNTGLQTQALRTAPDLMRTKPSSGSPAQQPMPKTTGTPPTSIFGSPTPTSQMTSTNFFGGQTIFASQTTGGIFGCPTPVQTHKS